MKNHIQLPLPFLYRERAKLLSSFGALAGDGILRLVEKTLLTPEPAISTSLLDFFKLSTKDFEKKAIAVL